jgi:hypothetical protein
MSNLNLSSLKFTWFIFSVLFSFNIFATDINMEFERLKSKLQLMPSFEEVKFQKPSTLSDMTMHEKVTTFLGLKYLNQKLQQMSNYSEILGKIKMYQSYQGLTPNEKSILIDLKNLYQKKSKNIKSAVKANSANIREWFSDIDVLQDLIKAGIKNTSCNISIESPKRKDNIGHRQTFIVSKNRSRFKGSATLRSKALQSSNTFAKFNDQFKLIEMVNMQDKDGEKLLNLKFSAPKLEDSEQTQFEIISDKNGLIRKVSFFNKNPTPQSFSFLDLFNFKKNVNILECNPIEVVSNEKRKILNEPRKPKPSNLSPKTDNISIIPELPYVYQQ